jgi:hypothetical protein
MGQQSKHPTLDPRLPFRTSASSREIPDPSFLDCGGLTPLWIFPSTRSTPSPAPSSRSTPRHPHGHKTPWATAELHPQPSASPRLRVRPQPNHPPSPREIPDPSFLDCGGLTPLWIFPFKALDPIQSSAKPEHSKTPSLPQNILGNCRTPSPTLRTFASSREIPDRSFLDCGGLTPLWIFPSTRSTPSQAPPSRSTPRHPHGHKTPWATAALNPQPSASPRLRVRPFRISTVA